MEYCKNLSLENLFYIDDDGLICCEEWRDVVGYEGLYKVSDLGRIKSLCRLSVHNYPIKEIILKQGIDGMYFAVTLCVNKTIKRIKVHQIVAESFLGHYRCGMLLVVDHIKTDDPNNKLNNKPSNLRIVTNRVNSNRKHIKSTSSYTGVFWDKINKKWASSIVLNKKKVHLGFFLIESEASEYYENALFCHDNNLPIMTNIKDKSSKYKGVSLRKSTNKWEVVIPINGKRKYIGTFNTEIEAHNACQNALKIAS